MPSRWSPEQRERSQHLRQWLLVLVAIGFVVGLVVMALDDPAATPRRSPVPAWLLAAIGISLFSFAALKVIRDVLTRAGGPRRPVGRRRRGANDNVAAELTTSVPTPQTSNDPRDQPLVWAVDQGFIPGLPVNSEHPDGPASGAPRPDWANAAARLGVALGVPIAGSGAFVLLDGRPNAWWLLLLWMLGLFLGVAAAWEAWHGLMDTRTLRVNPDHTELTGRTGWPLRRWRSVRLDQIARVNCRKVTESAG